MSPMKLIRRFRAALADLLAAQGPGHEDDFSPVALEVLDQPPAPFARAALLLILLLALILLAWSALAKVDIVVSATGVVVPRGKVKVIQPMEGGRVTAIHVRDGQQVRRDEVLVTMDSTESQADLTTIRQELESAALSAMRLRAQLSGDESLFQPGPASRAAEVKLQRDLLRESLLTEKARQAAMANELSRNQAERESLMASVDKQERALPLLKKMHEKKRHMLRKGLIPEIEYIQAQMAFDDASGNLEAEKGRLRAAEAQLAKAMQESQLEEREKKRDLLAELSEALNRRDTLTQELAKAANKQEYSELRAPIDGFVQQLAIHTIGGVVTPAQTLMVIVPLDDGLEVEAKVLNKDIGLIAGGQQVSVKVTAYPYTRYGDIAGGIEWVAQDAVMDEQLGPIYPVRISLQSTRLPRLVDRREGLLSPGMTVTTDIKVGKRRVIEFFLTPILRYTQESFREH
ncbi:HlyD family type I secretion periplasmic adaptor subunit [Desulfobulbus oralis]|uniref:Uncharacterized protein n=1 Tax=Desulfobulbus oralis TaxID=1986146 RepID=A0A2L1GN23_9BACT|nr:HlyD family type I secretion periplasmic adaptor subunit [Desulfobulbus oralis]AVD71085.1 hypothetical protein CAY53_05965 [Desulfobulbus oralis]